MNEISCIKYFYILYIMNDLSFVTNKNNIYE